MRSQAHENQAKAKRYLVLLKDDKKTSIRKTEKELKVQLVSSAELNRNNKASQIMSESTGIFYKNLNIAVVDEVPTDLLKASVSDPENPVIYWEEEREYRPATDMELDLLKELKNTTAHLQSKLDALEEMIKARKDDEDNVWKNATWGLLSVNMPQASHSGKGVRVAILDTGFYAAHPDFKDRKIEGKSFIPGEIWDRDGNGHGTHCTGTAVGKCSDDGKRYGVAYEAEIFIGKVLSDAGSGSTSGIIDAIDWALEKGCKVISMSLGSPVKLGENPSLIFEHTGEKAIEKGCLIVAAAGNDSARPDNLRPVSSPANCQSIMAVAAIDRVHNIARFSNGGLNVGTGGRIDLCGPGQDIFSSYSIHGKGKQLYRRENGTSMATPHVAGIAALYWEAFPNATASEIWLKLEKNARALNHLQPRDVGRGLPQAI